MIYDGTQIPLGEKFKASLFWQNHKKHGVSLLNATLLTTSRTYECSPSPQIKIMTPTLLNKFKENVRKCIVAIAQPNNFKNVQNMFNIIKTYKLDKDVIVQEYTTSYQIKQR